MKHFLVKLVLFLLPVIIVSISVAMLPIYAIVKTKEYYSIMDIIKHQQENNIIVNTSIVSTDKFLKYFTTEQLKPEILAVGTSRVMQFRKLHFKDNISFYNAGGIAANLNQCIGFLKSISYSPKIIILGLDQYFFNESYSIRDVDGFNTEYSNNLGKLLINSAKITYSDFSVLTGLNNFPENIGLNAVTFSDGFRSDGSYFYNRILNQKNTAYTDKFIYPFRDTMERIEKGKSRFQYGNDIYLKAIEQVNEILNICKEKNIHVIAVIPPYAPFVYEKMKISGKYNYINLIYDNLISDFNKYGFELYDFTDMYKLTNDLMYIDGFHGNDEVYNIILQEIKKQKSALSECIK